MRVYSPSDPSLMRTYNLLRPVSTHFRPATCVEVDCPDYTRGWRTRIPVGDEARLALIRNCGLRFAETTGLDSPEREFVFEPGQPCFRSASHRLSLEVPAVHKIRDGRRDLGAVSAQGWHDDLGEHLDKIRTIQERG